MPLSKAKIRPSVVTRKNIKKTDAKDRADVEKALCKFTTDPRDPSLKFKALQGFKNLYTIRATLSLRIYMIDTGAGKGLGEMHLDIIHIGNHDYVKRPKK